MPPFEYRPYDSRPWTGSIGDIIERQGQIPAEAALRIGQVQADAALRSGNAWAGAAQQTGQAISGAIQQATDPRRKLEAQQLESGGLALTEQKRAIALRGALSSAITKTPMADEGGVSVYDIPAITKNLPPEFQANADEVVKHLNGINEAFRGEQAAKLTVITRGATSLLAAGADPGMTIHFIDTLEKNKSWPKADLDVYRQFIQAHPDKVAQVLQQFVQPQKPEVIPEGATAIDPLTRQVVATGTPKPPTETELALKASGGDPALAMHMLKPDANAKPGTETDWVSRARRLAVAKNGGQPLTDQQTQVVDTEALKQFKETNTDPELRAANLAQKNLANALATATLGQVPTKEQAASVADDLVNHRIAPEQLVSLFSTRGKEGLAFKLAVTAEAKKLDPQFNFEAASAEYTLVKSPAFQNTVRVMDSTLESMPRLLTNAQHLGNGNWRSWNQLANAAANQFNATDLKRFKTDAVLVGDEVAKILSGGGTGSTTSDAKLKQGMDLIGQSDSVPAIAAALDEIQNLIGFRRKAMTRGTYMEGTSAVKPPAAAAAAKMIEAKDPQGNIHHAPAGTALPAGWTLATP